MQAGSSSMACSQDVDTRTCMGLQGTEVLYHGAVYLYHGMFVMESAGRQVNEPGQGPARQQSEACWAGQLAHRPCALTYVAIEPAVERNPRYLSQIHMAVHSDANQLPGAMHQ